MRIAGVFDRVDQRGQPYFSPDRARVTDSAERARLVHYLSTCPMVLRAHGMEPDPLRESAARVVPLHYRSDGVWVWQEACAYYLREYGVAPEPQLMAHLTERGGRVPTDVPLPVLQAAGAAVLDPGSAAPGSQPMHPDPHVRYVAHVTEEHPVDRPAAVLRCRYDQRGAPVVEALRPDLTWQLTGSVPFIPAGVAPPPGLVPVSEKQVSRIVDLLWRAATQRP